MSSAHVGAISMRAWRRRVPAAGGPFACKRHACMGKSRGANAPDADARTATAHVGCPQRARHATVLPLVDRYVDPGVSAPSARSEPRAACLLARRSATRSEHERRLVVHHARHDSGALAPARSPPRPQSRDVGLPARYRSSAVAASRTATPIGPRSSNAESAAAVGGLPMVRRPKLCMADLISACENSVPRALKP
jgi:hypothetical protein